MVRAWYQDLIKLAETDTKAAELLATLKEAKTGEEQDAAKIAAREYVWAVVPAPDAAVEPTQSQAEPTSEPEVDPQPEKSNDTKPTTDPEKEPEKAKETDVIFDMSALAFNPRLAKMGINREEELFLKGVCVRRLSHDDKILMRRSIYNKKHNYMDGKQQEFKKKRAKALAKAAKDPALIKYHNQRKYVDKIIEALRAHKNFTWMFTNIKGLTPEVMKELLQNPGNVNLFRAEYPAFVDKFNKKYGE